MEEEPSCFGVEGTGLRFASGRENPRLPGRTGVVWKCVSVVQEQNNPYQPKVECKFCGLKFVGGAARIEEHIVGGKNITKCKLKREADEESTELYNYLKEQLLGAHNKKVAKRQRKSEGEASNAAAGAARSAPAVVSEVPAIFKSFGNAMKDEVDNAVADFFYGCNIDFAVANHPLWRKAVKELISHATSTYKPPTRKRLSNDLLKGRTQHYHDDLFKKLPADAQYGLTVVCDGWDQFDGEHLINILAVGRTRVYFLGTIEISSAISEDATEVAKIIGGGILRVGPLNCVQVVTDTCSTMKAAWRMVEEQYPWITCSCCMPHVLNLLLKDISRKVEAIQRTIDEGAAVVNWFRNKKLKGARWRRKHLKEITESEMGSKAKTLMRPAPTRFCAYTYMLSRILEIKTSLKRAVVSEEYAAKKFDEIDDGDAVAPLLLSSGWNCFWRRAEHVKLLTTPVVKLLRRFDSNMPMGSKVYKSMFVLLADLEHLKKDNQNAALPQSWLDVAIEVTSQRWEYGHSPFHAAAYALDPEYQKELSTSGLDADGLEAVKKGLEIVVKRLALRQELRSVQPELNEPGLLQELPELKVQLNSQEVSQRVADFYVDYGSYLDASGPMTELHVQINAKRLRASDFWALHLSHLKHASVIAKAVVAQVCCASHAERNWKAYSRIKTPSRARLHHVKADQRVFLHNVLHQNEKLSDANFKAEVPEWDDVSSDESEELELPAL